MILCHKCSGTLAVGDNDNLYGCSCISGYVRDDQKPISRHEAIREQVRAASSSITFYLEQGRELSDPIFASTLRKLTHVMAAK